MRLIGILIVLAIIGIVAGNYMKSGSQQAGDRDLNTAPKEMIDEAKQTVEGLNKNMLQNEKDIQDITK